MNPKWLTLLAAILGGLALSLVIRTTPQVSTVMAPGRPLVVVDPGHGGVDPGAVGPGGLYEKHVNLAIAQVVAHTLSQHHTAVILTRWSDRHALPGSTYVMVPDLRHRAWVARHTGATVLVSIHSNTEPTHTVAGPIVYFVAADPRSAALADHITATLTGASRIRHAPRPSHHLVLVESRTAAVTVEVGFLTHPIDRSRLITTAYQQHLGQAIAAGILNYLHQLG